jgi:hypothetical protein
MLCCGGCPVVVAVVQCWFALPCPGVLYASQQPVEAFTALAELVSPVLLVGVQGVSALAKAMGDSKV